MTPIAPNTPYSPPPARIRTWNPRPVALADLGAVLVSGASALAVIIVPLGVIAAVENTTGTTVPALAKATVVPLSLTTTALALWLLLRRRRWTWVDLGFHRLGRRGLHLLWQIPVGVIASLVVMVLGAGLLMGMEPAEEPTSSSGLIDAGAGWILVALAGLLVVGPILEEIVFRRLLMGWLDRVGQRWLGRGGAVVTSTLLSSVLFALLHMVAPVILWTFLLGLCCALVTRWHGSLWAGFLFHLANNAIASTALIAALFVV